MWQFIFLRLVPNWWYRCSFGWLNRLYLWFASQSYWEDASEEDNDGYKMSELLLMPGAKTAQCKPVVGKIRNPFSDIFL